MKLTARIYEINKGKDVRCSYFATVKKQECEKLKLKEKEAYLLMLNNSFFPVVIRRSNSGIGRFMLGFTIPRKIGKSLSTKKDYDFDLVSKSVSLVKKCKSNDTLNLMNLIPEKSIRSLPIFLFDYCDKLLVWIYSKGNKLAILPKSISLSEQKYDLLELAGAFFCEGFKARKKNKHRDRFSFSNVDLKQIKWFVGATEKLLGIQKSEWFVQVLYPKDDLKSLKNVKSYWSSFGLSKEKIKIVKNIKTNEKCGVCILNIYNSSLAESFYYIAEECQELALQSKNNAIRFFRGLSRGDLGIGKTSHQTISFSTESEENAFFFKELCYKIDISTSQPLYDERGKKGYWNVYISHYDNFKRLIKFGCVTHYSRKKNLYNKFLNAKKNHHFNYLCAINSGHNTYRKLIFHMKIAESTSSGALIKYLRRGLITRKHDSSCYTYELSEAGKEELESLQRLNEWLAEKN